MYYLHGHMEQKGAESKLILIEIYGVERVGPT
jgi:hypothetical protein